MPLLEYLPEPALQECDKTSCEAPCLHRAILEAQYQHNPGGILLIDSGMRILSFNQKLVHIWNLPQTILTSRNGKASLEFMRDKIKDPKSFVAQVNESHERREEVGADAIELKDGRILYHHTSPIYDHGSYLGRVWYFLDITSLKAAHHQVDCHQTFLNTILDHISDGIIACDCEGNVTLCNHSSHKLLGCDSAAVTRQNIADLRFFEQDGNTRIAEEQNPFHRALIGETLHHEATVFIDRHDTPRHLRISGQAMFDADGEQLGAVMSMHDITDLQRAKEQLRFMAYHDQLTGLPNRRLFHDLLQHSLKQAHRNRQQIAVLFLDIDNFKHVNDQFGHDRGDELLQDVAAILLARLRDSDLLCRWGGDEFLVALLECDGIDGAIKVAEKLRTSLNDSMGEDVQSAMLSLSTGIAIFPDHGQDADRLIRNADMAMYMAKRSGKNRCELFLPADKAATR